MQIQFLIPKLDSPIMAVPAKTIVESTAIAIAYAMKKPVLNMKDKQGYMILTDELSQEEFQMVKMTESHYIEIKFVP